MVNRRLQWTLEKHGLLWGEQSAYRQGRSTLDNLVILESELQHAYINKQAVVAVLFDIRNAFDSVWRFGILQALKEWGFKGNLPKYIESFLANRQFKVFANGTLSGTRTTEYGVPQGSALSSTLFMVGINNIKECLTSKVKGLLYADDLIILCRSASLEYIKRNLQATIEKIVTWCETSGLQISKEKTKCILFSRRRNEAPCPPLHLGPHQIPCVDQVRFLGVTFDKRLNWVAHVSELRKRCFKRLKILQVLSGTSWGADRASLLKVYLALVCSKIDYGSIIYGSAKQPVLELVESIHFTGLRSVCGAFRTTPVLSLCAEAGISPLIFRRHRLAAKYICKVYTTPNHPCYPYIFRPKFTDLFRVNTSASLPLALRVNMIVGEVAACHMSQVEAHIPPWKYARPRCHLLVQSKTDVSTVELECLLREFLGNIENKRVFYTDGSHTGASSACAFTDEGQPYQFKLDPMNSVFSAELFAISAALYHAMSTPEANVVVCTDSRSSLLSMDQMYSDNPTVIKVLQYATMLQDMGKIVQLVWVPAHRGLEGNELADKAAASAHQLPNITPIPFTASELFSPLLKTIQQRWQEMWQESGPSKLKLVKNDLVPWETSCRSERKEEVLIARLRLGHTRLTHSFRMSNTNPPQCTACRELLSVQHIFEDCRKYKSALQRLGIPRKLNEALGDRKVMVDRVMSFLVMSQLYHQL